jgi:tetratricopeptide (TPR) repeat protein
MRRAVELARATGDPLTEFFALTHLGSQLAKEDLAESIEVRYAAHDVYQKRVSLDPLPPAQRDLIERQFASLQVLLGLGEFDRGGFETAIGWMDRGIAAQRAQRAFDELLVSHNYLAQVYASIGRFEPAVALLEEALQLHRDHDGPWLHPWVGYDLGLLGKVLLEMGRVGSAADVMREAVQISEATRHIDLLALVWNYQAEVLMHPGNPGVDLDAAERVLLNNLEVSSAAGLTRSAAQAASLLGQLHLRRNALDEASDLSTLAVAHLDRLGDMPAVRTEEILFNHALILDRLGRHEEASASLDRAWEVVQQKLAGMQAPENRSAFLERVPLTRAIRDALAARTPATPPVAT